MSDLVSPECLLSYEQTFSTYNLLLINTHVSSTSHSPIETRHTVPLGSRESAGQVVATPSHSSCGSHSPVDARHTKPEDSTVCWHRPLTTVSAVQPRPSSQLLVIVPEGILFGITVELSLAQVSLVRNGGASRRNVRLVMPTSMTVKVIVAIVCPAPIWPP